MVRAMLCATLRNMMVILALTIACAPGASFAVEDGWTFGGGLTLASIPTQSTGAFGFGANVLVRYGLTESLSLKAGAMYSFHPITEPLDGGEEGPALHLFVPQVGAMYALDIIDIIPYVTAGVTAYVGNPAFFPEGELGAGVGVTAGIGVDYRGWRELSIGGEVGYHAFLQELGTYPVFIHAHVYAVYHYEPF